MSGLAMSWSEWAKHDATALAGLVRRGDVSPRELAAQVSAGVDKLDSRLNAVLERFADVLENPDADGPNRDGFLYGVPMFLKDLGAALKGRTQECGSLMYKGAIAKATDPTVENFLNAGLVPIGRSTTPEHGMSFDTTTNYTGQVKVTRNPFNLERTSGGSSGGSAAVVAAGITPISMSGDGGGSTRIPASFCGLVGLKTTRGRVPRLLAQNEYGNRFSADGVVTRTVRDTAAALEYMTRVPNGGSFMHLGPPRDSYLGALARPVGKLKVGLSTGSWGRSGSVDSQVAARVREAAKLLESLGHHVEEIDDAAICDWNAMWQGYIMQWISRGALFEFEMPALGIKPDDLHKYLCPITYLHYEAAKRYDKFDVYRAMSFNNATTRAFGRLMERYDILLTPTLAIRAPQANGPYSLLSESNDLDGWVNMLADACRFTMPGNETGLPAVSVPAGLDADGLPIGVQVHGNFCAETTLLQVAAQIEAARPDWFNPVPANHVSKD